MTRIAGLLLAAGRGVRMGRFKQLLPWPGPPERPLVAAAHDTIAPICDAIFVVVGHRADEVLDALRPRPIHPVRIAPGQDMSESVRAGLLAVGRLHPEAAVLLHPADHPLVARATLDLLLAALARDATRAAIPTYEGRGGHPVLIPATLARVLVNADLSAGLGAYWRAHTDSQRQYPVEDPGVIVDLNAPADVRAATERLHSR